MALSAVLAMVNGVFVRGLMRTMVSKNGVMTVSGGKTKKPVTAFPQVAGYVRLVGDTGFEPVTSSV